MSLSELLERNVPLGFALVIMLVSIAITAYITWMVKSSLDDSKEEKTITKEKEETIFWLEFVANRKHIGTPTHVHLGPEYYIRTNANTLKWKVVNIRLKSSLDNSFIQQLLIPHSHSPLLFDRRTDRFIKVEYVTPKNGNGEASFPYHELVFTADAICEDGTEKKGIELRHPVN